MAENKENLLRGICIYRNVIKDSLVQAYISLLEALRLGAESGDLIERYSRFLSMLVERTELGIGRIVADPWCNHVMNLILEDENTFTRKAEYVLFEDLSKGLVCLAEQDLRLLQSVLFVKLEEISSAVELKLKEYGTDGMPRVCGSFHPLALPGREQWSVIEQSRFEIKQFVASASDWGQCIAQLADFARRNGVGMYGTYWAFRWVAEGHLRGIPEPDPIRLEDLISYERERERVVDNTRRFVQGYPANNVLLYGDRGTGKSSTIKGLLHKFGHQGLRLVEVSREGFKDFPEIMALLGTRPQRFIIFIDDLSFEEYETEYKSLKASLEGGLQAQPKNVLIYATSNRKYLIRETFGDRTFQRDGEDLHPADAQEEKISLADRFGLVVTFSRPDQKTYLEIVRGLAEKEGLSLNSEELETLALRWEMLNNGRSGRTAKQFIQDLLGRINMSKGV